MDSQETPTWAIPDIPNVSGQTFGATLRQSEIGLEVFGPRLAGARTSGNLQFDFSGGSPNTPNGVNFGLVRMRVASMRMDWKNTSIVAGQDNAFFSPLSPTSFASLAIPAFSYAGNLWGWIPQVRLEHRFNLSEGQSVVLQGGILDNVTGELPSVICAFRPGGREFGPAGLRRTRGMDAQRFWHASDPGRCRILQPPELGHGPRMWMAGLR